MLVHSSPDKAKKVKTVQAHRWDERPMTSENGNAGNYGPLDWSYATSATR